MSGQIYLCCDGSGLWKIGIASNPDKRFKQLKTGNPTIRMLFNIPVEYPSIVELELHTKYEEKRITGDWFDLSAEDLFYIFDRFLGENNNHSLEDFEVIHRLVSVEKKLQDKEWRTELDARIDGSYYE